MDNLKILPCVCGVEPKSEEYVDIKKFQISCDFCSCTSPQYDTYEVSVRAWNAMQSVLVSGWTSETPSIEGHYLVVGVCDLLPNMDAPTYVRVVNFQHEFKAIVMGCAIPINIINGVWHKIVVPPPPPQKED